ncbi:MAG: hypothetical protein KBT46_04610 [Ruminococcus sp.]|nr:hypothetical protein [Candidatus Copronaster equi]
MITALNIFKSVFCKVFAGLLALIMTFSNGLNGIFNGNIYPYQSDSKVIGIESLNRSQGVTTDGTAWYFSGKKAIVKIAFDNTTIIAANYNAITDEFKEKYGSAHIGGISYYNGMIYAPLEDSKKWEHPIVALYDAQTLKYTGICKELPTELLTRGVPWVAVDGERNLLYCSHSKSVEKLLCFDLDTLEYVKSIEIETPVSAIQGGEVYNGLLYVGTNDSTRAVYTINPDNGKVEKLFDRIMYQPKLIDNFGGEGEDLTVYPMEDGTLIHALDIGTLFIDSNLRHYVWE